MLTTGYLAHSIIAINSFCKARCHAPACMVSLRSSAASSKPSNLMTFSHYSDWSPDLHPLSLSQASPKDCPFCCLRSLGVHSIAVMLPGVCFDCCSRECRSLTSHLWECHSSRPFSKGFAFSRYTHHHRSCRRHRRTLRYHGTGTPLLSVSQDSRRRDRIQPVSAPPLSAVCVRRHHGLLRRWRPIPKERM